MGTSRLAAYEGRRVELHIVGEDLAAIEKTVRSGVADLTFYLAASESTEPDDQAVAESIRKRLNAEYWPDAVKGPVWEVRLLPATSTTRPANRP
jgi:hypothetical protein